VQQVIDDDSTEVPWPVLDARRSRGFWINWLFGAAILASVVVLALHSSDARHFPELLERAQPKWLLAGVLCQGATYLAQSSIWRMVARAGGHPLPAMTAYKLSLAKLFMDQALPSAGVSGTIVIARGLVARGVRQSAVFAGAIVNMIAYHTSYMSCLAIAITVAASAGHVNDLIVAIWIAVLVIAVALTVIVSKLAGRREGALPRWLTHLRLVRPALFVLRAADRHIVRNPRIIGCALLAHLSIVMLDTLTLWLMIRSLGVTPPFERVFASFMLSSFVRGFVPSGLGTFEAASVITLKLLGIALPVALSATLLFRLLSFWLPMLPGLIFSRAATR
jgi:P-type Mg2+ transporter